MRLRKIPHAEEILKENKEDVRLEPQKYKGKWKQEFFNNDHPIHIEVGMGKGQFVIEMAKLHPEINYIGIEVVPSIVVKALRKLDNSIPNLTFICIDANKLQEVFEYDEINRIYLNFSDPWPKNRHEKRRLTYKAFLSIFKEILDSDGSIHFKTDNQGLFEYSIISMSQFNMEFNFISLDLHNSDFTGNVMTEYEERFHKKGNRIYRMEAIYKK